MKLKLTSIALLSLFSVLTLSAQQSEKIIVTGSRFTYPLLEKWIVEYKKINPALNIKINPRGGPDTDSANLIINAHELSEKEIKPGFKVVDVNRYALLTVANSKSEFAKEYSQTGIKEKDIKKFFFEKWDPFEEEETKKKKSKAKAGNKNIFYTREQIACAPTTFARHYGFEQKDLIGKGIAGDDKHLIYAVLKDSNGVTYNNLGLVYDLKTRKVKNGLTVIPADLNNNGKLDEEENFYTTLDEVITKIENKSYSEIVVSNVNFSFPQDVASNKELYNFISWILNEGAKYNHEFGFLDQDKATLNKQLVILNSNSIK
jgi:phosphate transport system substrate-binding protein